MRPDPEVVERLFSEVVDLPGPARAIRLTEACSGDSALRAEVESLLAYSSTAEDIAGPIVELLPGEDSPPRLEPGAQLGPYRLDRVLGEGGMGVVYLARQHSPLERSVALKVLRIGMDTPRALARFDVERQTLARMNHPGIARVFDAGTDPHGRPFFVMEYVEGTPLTEWCQEHRLDTRGRLRLFVRVCLALQHAHEKGVIHRDIKPTNVLVTEVDGEPVPKIIDFGIARESLPDRSQFTRRGEIVGTPQYMSPEQARSADQDVDTRSDIYSLGILLYELLVGQLPFDDTAFRSGNLLEMQRVIVEDEAPRPSTRVTDGADSARDARGPSALRAELRGDLDWITLKALEKAPERRYASAAALADDVERYLADEPVLATPPSGLYRLHKFVRKHRVLVAAGLLVFVSLTGGLVVSSVLYRRSENRYEKLIRLGDTKRLADYRVRSTQLWPAIPANGTALEEWVEAAETLLARLPLHQENLAELRREALPYGPADRSRDQAGFPRLTELEAARTALHDLETKLRKPDLSDTLRRLYLDDSTQRRTTVERLDRERDQFRTWRFENPDLQWQHDVLAKLVEDLTEFGEPGSPEPGHLEEMRRRLDFARTVHARTLVEPAEAWRKAAAAVAAPDSPYRALELVPQLGLIPLGSDPETNLQEFAVLQSGKVPSREGSGRLRIDEESALVLVLLPGGSFLMGADRLRLGGTFDVELACQAIEPDGLVASLGVRSGDRLRVVQGVVVDTVQEAEGALALTSAGEPVELEIEREGARIPLRTVAPPNIDPHALERESPIHSVHLDPFFLSKFEVTQAQWQRMASRTPSSYGPLTSYGGKRTSALHPVETVSWADCDDLFRRFDLELPTEAQWEYAARAGSESPWCSGSRVTDLDGYANVADRFCREYMPGSTWSFDLDLDDGYVCHAPVGSYQPNAFGLYDMHGNVWEWCQDAFADYPVERTAGDGEVISSDRRRILRGGTWGLPAVDARSASRTVGFPDLRNTDLGARPARQLLPEQQQ